MLLRTGWLSVCDEAENHSVPSALMSFGGGRDMQDGLEALALVRQGDLSRLGGLQRDANRSFAVMTKQQIANMERHGVNFARQIRTVCKWGGVALCEMQEKSICSSPGFHYLGSEITKRVGIFQNRDMCAMHGPLFGSHAVSDPLSLQRSLATSCSPDARCSVTSTRQSLKQRIRFLGQT
jgi:hypothetical protein